VVLPEIAGFAALAAMILTFCNAAMELGAVYAPAESIAPAPEGLIDHFTPSVPTPTPLSLRRFLRMAVRLREVHQCSS